ncbi:hypothetical protein CEP54_010085 [Fusarium duplospermum]|uniref:Uncharacterized protein n=1 Tax=Fusarium duplospermum TaxID=1325734 RepID=A0A428PM23_9HYPO|nr:hypothetical protein CEP54_010085 [Fusarium duplospermum]
MKLSLGCLLFFLSVYVIAGGIGGAYERIFIWFAYQATIDAWEKDQGKVNVNDLDICKGQKGSGRHGTLKYNEFIQFTNKFERNGQTTLPTLKAFTPPDGNIDRAAQNLLDNGGVRPTWFSTRDVVQGANTYDNLVRATGGVLWDAKGYLDDNGAKNNFVTKAEDAVHKVVQCRTVAYDFYRIPEMKKYTDFEKYKIEPFYYNLGTVKGSQNAYIDIPQMAHDNGVSEATLRQEIADFEKNHLFQDQTGSGQYDRSGNEKTKGQSASGHKRAIEGAEDGESIAKTGSC